MINGGIYAAEVLPIKVLNVSDKMSRSAAVGTYPCSRGLVTRLVGGARRKEGRNLRQSEYGWQEGEQSDV
jgi:hypothetical protein